MLDINFDKSEDSWYNSQFTGIFTNFGTLDIRPHDPQIMMWAGSVVPCGIRTSPLSIGGAGWTTEAAKLACVGEAIERFQTYPLPKDQIITSDVSSWSQSEKIVSPDKWVLFLKEQYEQKNFPFKPYTETTVCDWVCFRQVLDGAAVWVPVELAYLFSRPNTDHHIAPSISTGLSCGRLGDPVLLRGLQEVIERDGLIGAWWGSYALEEWPADKVFAKIPEDLVSRIKRPNLEYRFYRIASPFSNHITIVTVIGLDLEGFCFSAGASCRETLTASWLKSILEAVQGRYYVRYLKEQLKNSGKQISLFPMDFAEHAIYYTLFPEKLSNTVLNNADRVLNPQTDWPKEDLSLLVKKLEDKPVLVRNMTPTGIAQQIKDWYVLKVVVPGLQPLHGNHSTPQLGGKLWLPRTIKDWENIPPHPFA